MEQSAVEGDELETEVWLTFFRIYSIFDFPKCILNKLGLDITIKGEIGPTQLTDYKFSDVPR